MPGIGKEILFLTDEVTCKQYMLSVAAVLVISGFQQDFNIFPGIVLQNVTRKININTVSNGSFSILS